MDTITVAKTDHLENVVASSGNFFVANGNLMFNAKNEFLHKLMIQAEKKFSSLGWNSLGLRQKWSTVVYILIIRASSFN